MHLYHNVLLESLTQLLLKGHSLLTKQRHLRCLHCAGRLEIFEMMLDHF